ncbi:MAG TPA: asparaginase [Steroidobacter sp.]
MSKRPWVAYLALGGTIAMTARDGGLTPNIDAAGLVASARGAALPFEVVSRTVRQAPSAGLRYADIAELASLVREAAAQGAQGAVITMGTDTLEETAFGLDLLLDLDTPVVVTGALRGPEQPGADGPANLLCALLVAASPAAAGLGVLVVMNEEIHAARFVRKAHTHKASAFESPALGPLGWVAEGRVRILLRPTSRSPVLQWRSEPPFVPLIALGLSSVGEELDPYLQRPPAAAVLAALGAGHASAACTERLGTLAAQVPVVLASRVGAGEIYRHTYGYAGAEIDLLSRGLIHGGFLDPFKARVLLSLLIAQGADRAQIEHVFASL